MYFCHIFQFHILKNTSSDIFSLLIKLKYLKQAEIVIAIIYHFNN